MEGGRKLSEAEILRQLRILGEDPLSHEDQTEDINIYIYASVER